MSLLQAAKNVEAAFDCGLLTEATITALRQAIAQAEKQATAQAEPIPFGRPGSTLGFPKPEPFEQDPFAYQKFTKAEQQRSDSEQLEPGENNDWKKVSYIRETLNAEQAEQEPVATHICNLWVDPITKEYVVDHCDHPIEELIPAYSTSQYLSKKPDYWLGYGLQAYTQKPFEGATPLYAAPVRTKDLTDDEMEKAFCIGGCRAVIQEYRRKNGIV